jgi:DNA-binding Lrp family transcriptional regulator
MPIKKPVKLDAINRKILAKIHLESDITNAKLAEFVNLSPAASSQRSNALKEAGYYFNSHAEVDLKRICERIIAYVEFTLSDNSLESCQRFEAAIEVVPEFMDCLRYRRAFEVSFDDRWAHGMNRFFSRHRASHTEFCLWHYIRLLPVCSGRRFLRPQER